MKNVMKKVVMMSIVFILAFTVLSVPVLAANATTVDVTPITNSITGMGETLKGFAGPIFFLMIVVSGIAMMAGQSGRQWAKTTLLFSSIGLFLVFSAASITSQLTTQFSM